MQQMSRSLAGLSVAAFLLVGVTHVGAIPTEPVPPALHKLPKDPKAVVVSYDFRGGMLARQSNDPSLTVRADGTVEMIVGTLGAERKQTAKLAPAELHALLRFILDENKFFEFDEKKVAEGVAEIQRAAVQAGPNGVVAQVGPGMMLDGGTEVVRVQADGKDHTVKYYNLAAAAKQYAQLKSLGQLSAICKRLGDLQSQLLRKPRAKSARP